MRRYIGIIGLGLLCSPVATLALNVITTTTILQDWAQQLTPAAALTPANTDLHTFEPSLQDILRLQSADLIVAHGLGLEAWLPRLLAANHIQTPCNYLSECLPKESLITHNNCDTCHKHCEYDPHTWLDVQLAQASVQALCDILSTLDPSKASDYAAKCAHYKSELQALDQSIESALKAIPNDKRKLLCEHDNLQYFAKRYGLHIAGSILHSTSSDTHEPSASRFVALIQLIQTQNITALFQDASSTSTLPSTLAKEAKLPAPHPLYTESLGQSPNDTYIAIMHYNAQTMVQALKP